MDYDLMHERSRDTYIIQGQLQQEGVFAQLNSLGRGKFNPCGGFRGRWGVGMGRGLFSITMPNQVIWQGIVRTLVLLPSILIHLTMSLNTVQYC
jgi:hypothetical protein